MAEIWARSQRVNLCVWSERHRTAFNAMNADPDVMRYFPEVKTTAASNQFFDALQSAYARNSFTFLAAEHRETGAFLGMIGLHRPQQEFPFGQPVEIGWRLIRAAWGHGYATEAAASALHKGFSELKLPEIVAFTPTHNLPSQAVMQRLGMVHDPADNFDHPSLPPAHRLSRHVLYRKKAPR